MAPCFVHSSFLALFRWAALLSLVQVVVATQYSVGDSSGWSLGVDYSTWASQQTFHVGDSISFSYAPGSHSVLQVSQQDYQSCNTANPLSSDNAGNKIVHLTKPGNYYFICGTQGHCGQGMQLTITVTGGSSSSSSSGSPASSSSSSPSSSSPSTPSSPSSSSPSSASRSLVTEMKAARAWMVIVAVTVAYHFCISV